MENVLSICISLMKTPWYFNSPAVHTESPGLLDLSLAPVAMCVPGLLFYYKTSLLKKVYFIFQLYVHTCQCVGTGM